MHEVSEKKFLSSDSGGELIYDSAENITRCTQVQSQKPIVKKSSYVSSDLYGMIKNPGKKQKKVTNCYRAYFPHTPHGVHA